MPDEVNPQPDEQASKQALTSKFTLHIPEGVAYNCQGCGRCCSGWGVGLTESDYDKVKDIDWSAHHPPLAGKELFVNRQAEFAAGTSRFPHYTKFTTQGSCSFLIDDQCLIHKTLGEDFKPGTCKLFPYTFVASPTGVYVGLVYDSYAAVRNLGRLLSDQRPMLEKLWQVNAFRESELTKQADQALLQLSALSGSPSAKEEFTVNLANGLPISWEEYLSLEGRLEELFLAQSPLTFYQSLIAGSELIIECVRRKRSGEEISGLRDYQPPLDMPVQPPTKVEKWLFYLLCFRCFSAGDFRGGWEGMPTKPVSKGSLITSAMRTVFSGKTVLPHLGNTSLEQALKYEVEPFPKEIEEFFRRYFYMKIFSKLYFGPAIAGLSVLAGYNNLLANFLCSMVFAKARAAARRETCLAVADLYEVFHLIDKEMVAFAQFSAEYASFYDVAFSSPRLFNGLLGTLDRSTIASDG